MSNKNQVITDTTLSESSNRLVDFLEETGLHKKDFAEMIGVTLSYVYSLIDNTISFSTRTTTLERIAVIMDVSPAVFPEYRAPEEPKLLDPGVQFLKQRQKELQLNNVQFLKRFSRQKRLELVDLWRGAEPLPLDWNQLASIAEILDLSPKEIYPYWQARLQQYLVIGGIDLFANTGLINSMFEGAKGYLKV